jgi:predicted DCC family thiol-disulfide oxidoreductase YuxK
MPRKRAQTLGFDIRCTYLAAACVCRCNFCNAWVNFVLGAHLQTACRSARMACVGPTLTLTLTADNDPDGVFQFASMQSPAGRRLLDTCGRPPDDLSTFVVLDAEGFWTQSTAALRVAQGLPRPALNVLGAALLPLPSAVRDIVYQTVATNRYSILGRDADGATPSCMLRNDAMAMQERFLDDRWPADVEAASAWLD